MMVASSSAGADDVVIRAMSVDDADALAELMRQPRVLWGTLQRPHTPVERRRAWLQKMLDDASGMLIGADVGGRLVGNLGLHLHATNPRRRHAAMLGMSVHDDFAGRGVGTALMRAAVDAADNWFAVRRLELEVFTDNEAAVHLYTKFGFEIEGTMRQYAFRDGEYADTYVMSRLRP